MEIPFIAISACDVCMNTKQASFNCFHHMLVMYCLSSTPTLNTNIFFNKFYGVLNICKF